jgi:hypothetical protein
MQRRRFLLVCTAAVSGIWFQPSGLTTLARNVVMALSGDCTFCGKRMAEARAMARAVGTRVQICDECVGLCLDLLSDSNVDPLRAPDAVTDADELMRDLLKIRDAHGHAYAREVDAMVAELRARLDGSPADPSSLGDLACSMCAAQHRDVRKLIAGPTVYICDRCVGEAALATRLFVA